MVNVYPLARQVPAHSSKYRVCDPKRVTYTLIVLHITDGHADPMGPARRFATAYQPPPAAGMRDERPDDAKKKTSAHFIVGQVLGHDGEVIQSVDLGDVAYHASGMNTNSVGIEHCARSKDELYHGDPGLPLTNAQYAASAKLCAWLCRLAGLPIDREHIKGHNEVSPQDSHDDCPTGQLDWVRYIREVEAAALAFSDLSDG